MRKHPRLLLLGAATLLVFALASSVLAQSRADTLVVGISTPPVCLDPPFVSSVDGDSINGMIFDRLGFRSQPDMSPVLVAAESLDRVDPLTWQVKLHDGMTFHNGDPVTADAVKASIDRYTLDGADHWYYQQANIDHVDVVDRLTANIVTKAPFALMPSVVAASWFLIDPAYAATATADQMCSSPIGSGPYRVASYVKDDRVVLERNDDYWGPKPAFKTVIYRIIPDEAARLAELQVGNIDIMEKLPIDRVADVKTMTGVQAVSIESGRRVFMMGDKREGSPLQDPKVMIALQHAVDVDTIIDTLLGGFTSRMATFPNAPTADPNLKPYSFDPELAKKMLADAGYPNGFNLNIWSATNHLTNQAQVAQAVGAYLQAVGLDVHVNLLEWSVFVSKRAAGELDGLIMDSQGPEYNDQGDLQGISANYSGGMKPYGWHNQQWDAMYEQLRNESDLGKRKELALQLQQIAYDDPPILMLYNEPNLYGVSDRINWTPRPDERVYVRDATLK